MFNSIMYRIFITFFFITHTITFALAQDNIFLTNYNTSAEYAYLLDYESGEVLYDKSGNIPMAPSSMTKMMTSYIAFKKLQDGILKLSDKFIISRNASKKGGSKMFLKSGQRVSVDELLKGVIVLSGNDASIALAESLHGSEEEFANEMNIFAHKLGLKDTVFKNSTGWPDEGHLMSARDLAILATRLVKDFPEYYHYHSIRQYSFNKVRQNNRNTLIGLYGVDGIKTGKTDIAGHGIVISAKKNGRRLIAVINGLKSEKEREYEAKKILDFGFLNFKNLTLFNGQKEVVEADVIYGNLNQISLNVQGEIVITVPLEYDRMKNLLFLTKFKEPLEAPIKKGDVVGKLKIMDNKERILIKEVDLIASTDVEKSGVIKRVFQGIKYFFKKLIS